MSDYSLYSIDSNILFVSAMLAASDISSFLKMFKHKKDGLADIPSGVRCKLMRVFREKMMTISPDSNRSYFDFGASKTGFFKNLKRQHVLFSDEN